MATDSSSPSIIIRSYQPADLSACQEIFTGAHREYDNPMVFIQKVLQTDMADIEKNYLQIPNGHWWVAVSTDDNRIVGQVAVLPLQLGDPSYYKQAPEEQRDQTCELLRMGIALDAQRRGIGEKLVSMLINFAREKGYCQIHLTTLASMNKACGFYEKRGFTKGPIQKLSFGHIPEEPEEIEKFFSNPSQPTIIETDADLSEEDRRLMKLPLSQSKAAYVQNYFMML